ncbi:PLC-like phosphodiesterase [Trametopsis cervina]|nr:PLC-like phosphodiesterase [Trametopsis cervina]
MGQGGQLLFVNGSPYNWSQTYIHSYQMNSWSFPNVITAGSIASVYVEWGQNASETASDDGAEVRFAMQGTSHSFQMQARATTGFNLQAMLDNLTTQGNPQGTVLDLGWNHDSITPFILSGTDGYFSSTNTPPNWMQANLPSFGNRTIRHLCIPGSHDSGMSNITGKTAFVDAGDVLTQSKNIGAQLSLGARYFDVRPVIASGHFAAGHYSQIEIVGWQGADGQTFDDMISQINAFTASNKELIILNLSHDLNTDSGYLSLTQDEWNRLFQQLTGLNNLFVAPNPTTVDLTTLTLNQYIGNGQAAVVIVVQPGNSSITLGNYATRGFYRYSQFNAYNSYADTDDLDTMITDQLNKMRTVRTSQDSQLFLLSWTLTQDAGDIVSGDTILDLANKADPTLYSQLLPACSTTTYPNILYIDNFNDSNPTALAISISHTFAS